MYIVTIQNKKTQQVVNRFALLTAREVACELRQEDCLVIVEFIPLLENEGTDKE